MKAKLIKNGNAYSLNINDEYVAFVNEDFIGYATQEFRDNLLGKLSLKNCQAIELGYDLDELVKEQYPIDEPSFKRGFKLDLEILGDKKFSEEDMEGCWYSAHQAGRFEEKGIAETNWQTAINYAQSLQQTEWDVKLEMENKPYKYLVTIGEVKTSKLEPKLDADGYIILKII